MTKLEALRGLVMKAKLQQAYEVLSLFYDGRSDQFIKDKLMCQDLQRDYYVGIITDEDYRANKAKLVERVLHYINEAEEQASEEVLLKLEDKADEVWQHMQDDFEYHERYIRVSEIAEVVLPIAIIACLVLSVFYDWYWIQVSIGLVLVLLFFRD